MVQKCLIRREMAKKLGGRWLVCKNLCQEQTFLFSYLCSDIKIKPKNHGIHESCKPLPPPPYVTAILNTRMSLYPFFIKFQYNKTRQKKIC